MSQSNNRPPPAFLAIGGEIARGMVTLHMRGAAQFVQTQVDFLSAMQSANAPDETRRVQRQYVEAMCSGAQQHAEGLMAVFAGATSATQSPTDESVTEERPRANPPRENHEAVSNSSPTAAKTPPAPATTEEQEPLPARPSPASAVSDDLTQVSGIGRVFATKLAALGITRFSDLANLDVTALDDENHPLHDYRARVVSDEWVEQARALAIPNS